MNILGITGHRPNKLNNEYSYDGPVTRYIAEEIEKILDVEKPDKLISGMALGVDTIFALVAIKRNIPFIAAVPFEGQERAWPKSSQELYHKILSRASEIVVVSHGGYTPWKMQKRNEWMVDYSNKMIAVFNQIDQTGGTFNCIKYIEKVGKEIIYVNPNEVPDEYVYTQMCLLSEANIL